MKATINDILECVFKLNPDAKFGVRTTKIGFSIKYNDDSPGIKPTIADCTIMLTAVQNERIANEYKQKRKDEYPPIQDQLDMIYNLGVDGWKSEIKKIKDKYPKPE